jgi:hypothetical protein
LSAAAPHFSTRGHAASNPGGTSGGGAAAALAPPSCSTATAAAPTLNHVTTVTTAIGGAPFGATVTADDQYSFVTVGDALNGKPALLGYVPTGPVPRQLAVPPDGTTMLVTVENGHSVEGVNLGDLP